MLTTRVTAPTEADWTKLQRLLRYLHGSRDPRCIISTQAITGVVGFVDASHGCHPDKFGHSGMVIKVGGTVVVVKSKKLRKNAKDSTAAELVAVSDRVVEVISISEILTLQGFKLSIPVVKQDNQSCIKMVTPGAKQ